MARPNDVDFGKIIFFQHESLEACIEVYRKRINPQLKLDLLKDIMKWHESFQERALLVERDDASYQQELRDKAAELVSLICVFIVEFVD